MAHTKAVGTTKLGRDSQPKYLGVKLSDGQVAHSGSIIVRQRGSKFTSGTGAKMGKDYTIYAVQNGKVKFLTKRVKKYNGHNRLIKVVSVV